MDKTLKISDKQLLRGLVLNICQVTGSMGAGLDLIYTALKKEGYVYTKEAIEAACSYLQGRNFITVSEVKNEVLGIHKIIAKITPDGTDLLEGTITAEGIQLM